MWLRMPIGLVILFSPFFVSLAGEIIASHAVRLRLADVLVRPEHALFIRWRLGFFDDTSTGRKVYNLLPSGRAHGAPARLSPLRVCCETERRRAILPAIPPWRSSGLLERNPAAPSEPHRGNRSVPALLLSPMGSGRSPYRWAL